MKRLWLLLALLASGPALAQQPLVMPIPTAPTTIPLTAGSSATNTTLTAVLSGNTTTFDYICGFVATSGGTSTPTVVNLSITGVKSPMTFSYQFPNPGQGLLGVAFPGCVTASVKGQGITVTFPAPSDTPSQMSLSAWGYAN